MNYVSCIFLCTLRFANHQKRGMIMTSRQFITLLIQLARDKGYEVKPNRNGQEQIDFGHKKIHSAHLEQLFPRILDQGANLSFLIDAVAPGRPYAHRPVSEIIESIKQEALLSG